MSEFFLSDSLLLLVFVGVSGLGRKHAEDEEEGESKLKMLQEVVNRFFTVKVSSDETSRSIISSRRSQAESLFIC